MAPNQEQFSMLLAAAWNTAIEHNESRSSFSDTGILFDFGASPIIKFYQLLNLKLNSRD